MVQARKRPKAKTYRRVVTARGNRNEVPEIDFEDWMLGYPGPPDNGK
jgi:hypothetical protein